MQVVAPLRFVCYDLRMEPISNLELTWTFIRLLWPVWLVLGAVCAVYFWGGGADTYEEPPAAPRPDPRADKYHSDDSWGR